MSFTPFALTKSWESAADFPTYEEEEAKVRSDMQCLFDELAAGINALIEELEKNSTNNGTAGANGVGIDAIAGLTGVTNVQAALAYLKVLIDNASVGSIPDHSLVSAKLSRKTDVGGAAVSGDNIAAGAVGTTELASGAVTGAKTDFSSGLAVGGSLTANGQLNVNDKIILDSDCYGDTLPADATEGRLFFLKAT